MTGSPYARVDVSKLGLLVGLALVAFGLYASAGYFRPGGRGHGATALRALLAIPVGGVAIYLSFSTVCSGCGAGLAHREIATSPARAGVVVTAAALADGPAVARAEEGARTEPGIARIAFDVCPQCRRFLRLRARGAGSLGDRVQVLAGDAAVAAVDVILAGREGE